MDFNSTIDLIIRELEEAREIIDDLKKFPGAPVIQIELAKSKCRNAAEVISLLKQQDVPDSSAEPENIKTTPSKPHGPGKKKEPSSHDIVMEITEEKEEDAPSIPVVHAEKPVSEPVKVQARETPPEKKAEIIAPVTKEKPAKETEKSKQKAEQENNSSVPEKPFVAPIIADTFSHLANRFNEQMGETRSEDFSYTHGSRLTNLAEAIGINDKFFYIREIFNGDREAYNKAISKLEQAENLTEAKVILMSFSSGKTDTEAMKQLLDLVKRKLSGHE